MPASFIARQGAATKTGGRAAGEHVEFDLGAGAAGVVSTGVGQANGLITVQNTSVYWLSMGIRVVINEGYCVYSAYDNVGGTDLVDIAGQVLRVSTADNGTQPDSESTSNGSFFALNAGDVIKMECLVANNPVSVSDLTFFNFIDVATAQYYVARMSVDQTFFNVGEHVEFNIEAGNAGLATVSTGAGQAQGLITINQTGTYWLSMGMYAFSGSVLFYEVELQDDLNVPVADVCGVTARIYSADRFGTDRTESSFWGGVYNFTAGDIVKLRCIAESADPTVGRVGTTFSLLKLA
jgi:hypothetical protein